MNETEDMSVPSKISGMWFEDLVEAALVLHAVTVGIVSALAGAPRKPSPSL